MVGRGVAVSNGVAVGRDVEVAVGVELGAGVSVAVAVRVGRAVRSVVGGTAGAGAATPRSGAPAAYCASAAATPGSASGSGTATMTRLLRQRQAKRPAGIPNKIFHPLEKRVTIDSITSHPPAEAKGVMQGRVNYGMCSNSFSRPAGTDERECPENSQTQRGLQLSNDRLDRSGLSPFVRLGPGPALLRRMPMTRCRATAV